MILLAGCVPQDVSPSPSITPNLSLIPYSSPTPRDISSQTPMLLASPTSPPPPTPTPITYTIVVGDTMLAIALRYGISLEELLAANPEVNPRALSVDTVLIIPSTENSPSVPVTATPISIIAQSVDHRHGLVYHHEFLPELGNRCLKLVYPTSEKLCAQDWAGNVQKHSIAMSGSEFRQLFQDLLAEEVS